MSTSPFSSPVIDIAVRGIQGPPGPEGPLSRAWAEGEEPGGPGTKSSKQHALDAAAQAELATEKTAEVIQSGNGALAAIVNERAAALGDVATARGGALADIAQDRAAATGAIASDRAAALGDVATARGGALADIAQDRAAAADAIANDRLAALDAIGTTRAAAVTDVTNAATAQIATAAGFAAAASAEADRSAASNRPVEPFQLIAGAVGYKSAANRLECNAGRWSFAPANTPRRFIEADGTTDLLAEGEVPAGLRAATVHLPLATNNSSQMTFSGAGSEALYSGAHAGPDLFQLGQGRSIRWKPGASSSAHFGNITVTPVSTVRVVAWVVASIVTPGLQFRLGTRRASDGNQSITTFDMTTAGDFTYSASVGGARLVQTLADGSKLYQIWVDVTAHAGATVSPLLSRTGTWTTNDMVYICGLTILPDPPNRRPSGVPLLQNGPLIADTVLVGPRQLPANVHWLGDDIAVGSCGNTTVEVACPATFLGYAALPRFQRLLIFSGGASAQRTFLLPCAQAPSVFSDTGLRSYMIGANPKGVGQRWFDVRVQRGGANATAFTFEGAYDDPMLWPGIRGFQLLDTTGAVTIRRIVPHIRVGNSDFVDSTNALRLRDSAAPLVEDVLVMGAHASAVVGRSLTRRRALRRGTVTSYFEHNSAGRGILIEWAQGPITVNRVAISHVTNGLVLTGTGTNAYTANITDFHCDKWQQDAFAPSIGYWTVSLTRASFGEAVVPEEDTWQSQFEIEVDTGSGWQALSASGVALASLQPQWFYRAGTHAAGVVNATDANDSQYCFVSNFTPTISGATSRPNYQWQATGVFDVERNIAYPAPNNAVWVNVRNGDVSAANPRIRLRSMYGRYNAGPTWATLTTPQQSNTGYHADISQPNSTTRVVNWTFTDVVSCSPRAQGFFIQALSNLVDVTVTNCIIGAGLQNNLSFGDFQSVRPILGTQTISNTITFAPDGGTRFTDGSGVLASVIRGLGPDANIVIGSNVWVSTTSGLTSGIQNSGGIVTGAPNTIAMGRITNYTTIAAPAADQPGVRSIETIFDGITLASSFRVPGTVRPKDIRFRPGFVDATGVDWNGIVTRATATEVRLEAAIAANLFVASETLTVARTAAVGTVIRSGLNAGRIVNGDMFRRFRIRNGQLQVAAAFPTSAVTEAYGLELDDGTNLFVTVTP
ncbi:hypothetical protein ACLBKU_17405 [Erythrobacter sp. NE805]|uniref:hypothetical protein n=1 Tax=Erythrobacter sp. NE805 TaxID=3389875 RepID=UPI00396B1E4F